jgi:hypothetical protein
MRRQKRPRARYSLSNSMLCICSNGSRLPVPRQAEAGVRWAGPPRPAPPRPARRWPAPPPHLRTQPGLSAQSAKVAPARQYLYRTIFVARPDWAAAVTTRSRAAGEVLSSARGELPAACGSAMRDRSCCKGSWTLVATAQSVCDGVEWGDLLYFNKRACVPHRACQGPDSPF